MSNSLSYASESYLKRAKIRLFYHIRLRIAIKKYFINEVKLSDIKKCLVVNKKSIYAADIFLW